MFDSVAATEHGAVGPLGEQEHGESNAAGLKWKPAGETLAVLCGFMQREGWFYFCVC